MERARRILFWLGAGLLWAIVALCLAVVFTPPFLDRLYYRGPASSHFDGAHFFNLDGDRSPPAPPGTKRTGFLTRWIMGDDDGRPDWPDAVAVKPAKPQPFAAPRGMTATWVGHATVLVQAAGLNILTDPIWSDVASPLPPFGPKRVAQPGVRFDDLPKIDLILISHNHYDHLDLPTLKRLWARDKPKIVTSLGNDAILRDAGIPATALDWGQSVSGAQLNGLPEAVIQCNSYEHCPDYRVHVTRAHHWSSRWGTDRNRALWSSFVIETRAGNIFFAGDTGAGDMAWPAEAARIGPIRLALIPIGAFRFWKGQMQSDAHIGPVQAVELFEKLGASTAIPIHWGTFRLSYEKLDTPPRMLELALRCEGIERKRFAPLRIGQSLAVPTVSSAPRGPKHCDADAIKRLE
jgi:L-ascorbate metabolism protein UlaG (beta-lactamase superfamily)